MIEAPLDLQKTLTLPDDHIAACKAGDTPYAGNAAGNTKDLLDLSGQNKAVAPLPAGYVACFEASSRWTTIADCTLSGSLRAVSSRWCLVAWPPLSVWPSSDGKCALYAMRHLHATRSNVS